MLLLFFAKREIGAHQCGFRRNKSATDQIFTLRMILEKAREYNLQTHHLFVDFRSAYDSVRREELYKALYEMSDPHKLVRLIRMTMEGVRCKVRVQRNLSFEFRPNKGLGQGDALSC